MNPCRARKMREAEEAYGRPFWEQVRLFAEQGMSRCRTAELMGYSKEGFLNLLESMDAPGDISWWNVPATVKHPPKRDPETVERARLAWLHKYGSEWVTYKDETLPLVDWARRTGISIDTLRGRYRRGIRGRALFDKPMSKKERGRIGIEKRKQGDGGK